MSDFPSVGDAIPDIAMETPDGGSVKPSDFKGKKLVIFFYPKDDTPGCTTENKDFSALADEFAAAGTCLLGVSKDPAKKHQKFIAKHDLKAPLASDPEEGACRCAWRVGRKADVRQDLYGNGPNHLSN